MKITGKYSKKKQSPKIDARCSSAPSRLIGHKCIPCTSSKSYHTRHSKSLGIFTCSKYMFIITQKFIMLIKGYSTQPYLIENQSNHRVVQDFCFKNSSFQPNHEVVWSFSSEIQFLIPSLMVYELR